MSRSSLATVLGKCLNNDEAEEWRNDMDIRAGEIQLRLQETLNYMWKRTPSEFSTEFEIPNVSSIV